MGLTSCAIEIPRWAKFMMMALKNKTTLQHVLVHSVYVRIKGLGGKKVREEIRKYEHSRTDKDRRMQNQEPITRSLPLVIFSRFI